MRILLVNKFYYLAGGAERYVQMWERLLRAHGHEVIPFAMQDARNWPTPFAAYFAPPARFSEDAPLPEGMVAALRSIYSCAAQEHLRHLVRHTRPDLAHVHSYCYQLTPAILQTLREAGVPVFQTAHEYKHICPNQHLYNPRTGCICERCRDGRWYSPLFARCIKGSLGASAVGCLEHAIDRLLRLSRGVIRRVIAPSLFLRRKLIEFGFDARRVVHVPNFVDATEFTPTRPPGDYFLFVGRLVTHKGIRTLLAAACGLPQAPLKIVGDGPLRPEVEQTLATRRAHHVELLGFLTGEALRHLVEEARAVIVPSEWHENCPLVVLEAMAAGRAVIAAACGGIPELVRDGETGVLFPRGDCEALIAAMTRVWQDKDAARQMGVAGRRVVEERYGPEAHYGAMMRIFGR